jgi:acetolactate synthase-1/2/3 large subunit
MTQKSYFNGHYIGCDIATGLGLPRWKNIFEAFDIPVLDLEATNPFPSEVVTLLDSSGPAAFLVPVDPNQTYYPKITSQISNGGSLISNPIHLMTPALPEEANIEIFTYLKP